jgi:hypothetical protein
MEPSSLRDGTARSNPRHERGRTSRRDLVELRRYVLHPGDDLRPLAREYARDLGLGRDAKKGLDALSQFLETMARTAGVQAFALVSMCESDLRLSLSVRVFISGEPGTETSAISTRAAAEANAALFSQLSPFVPFGGLRFHYASPADLPDAERQFRDHIRRTPGQSLLGFLSVEPD